MRAVVGLVFALVAFAAPPATALAHDDPVVTIRVLCNGFNVLDLDAVLGEIADTATLTVDRPVHGTQEIQAWVTDEMAQDLRIEIVDIGTPQRLPDGYTLIWTARLSRQDWRQAGVSAREMTNTVTIHNGRITDWTASQATSAASGGPPEATQPLAVTSPPANGFPELFGIPVTLLLAAGLIVLAASILAFRRLHS